MGECAGFSSGTFVLIRTVAGGHRLDEACAVCEDCTTRPRAPPEWSNAPPFLLGSATQGATSRMPSAVRISCCVLGRTVLVLRLQAKDRAVINAAADPLSRASCERDAHRCDHALSLFRRCVFVFARQTHVSEFIREV